MRRKSHKSRISTRKKSKKNNIQSKENSNTTVKSSSNFQNSSKSKSNISIIKFSKKLLKSQTFLFVILFLLSLYLSISLRTYSWSLKGIETNYIHNYDNYVKSQIKQQLLANFVVKPPEQELNKLVDKKFKELIVNQIGYKQQLKEAINKYKQEYKNENNDTYLLAIDPYYYYRRVKNILNHNNVCDVILNGSCYDNHMQAPFGVKTHDDFHSEFSAHFYKFVSLFSHISVERAFFFVPIVIMSVAVVGAFILGSALYGPVVGFMFSAYVGLNTAVLSRTMGGFSDTDAYNIMYSIIVTLFAFLAFKYRKHWKKLIISLSFFALSLFLFSKTWSAWWYLFDILIIALFFDLIYVIILSYFKDRKNIIASNTKHKKRHSFKLKNWLFSSRLKTEFLFIILFFIFAQIGLMFSGQNIFNAITAGQRSTHLKVAANSNYWPNVFTTVAELNFGNFNTIKNALLNTDYLKYLGFKPALAKFIGSFLFLFLIFGILCFIYDIYRNPNSIFRFVFFVFITWFLAMSYATLQGVRFAMYLVPPYAFFVSFGVYYLLKLLKQYAPRFSAKWYLLISIVTVFLFIYPSYASAHFLALNSLPSMSDGWYNSLTYIKNHSNSSAIINSWWDFGHWFKAIADRSVTFDGASQNSPRAYWVGKLLMSSDMRFDVAILRMLDCGGNRAFNILNTHINDTALSIKLLLKLLNESKQKVIIELRSKGFSDSEISTFVNYTFCKAPEDFFITSQDMVGKSGVWAHFGAWNFTKAKMWDELKRMNFDERKKYLIKRNYSVAEASKMSAEIEKILKQRDPERVANNWISPWPSYLSSKSFDCNLTNSSVVCPLHFGLNTNNAKINLERFVFKNNTGYFDAVIYGNGGVVRTKINVKRIYFAGINETKTINQDSKLELGVALNNNKLIIGDYRLVDSLFTKLFFFEQNQKYFDKVYETWAAGTGKVIVWKVNWSSIN